ncbi:polysaccharide biosynthesis tyrosine autokinase [Burkholderia stagnalis]|uniref:polysaccharide biosynthesis tyrosine autokinase n=1 Tax=Burkholderia stagnalis TaxID=1503054 RepID=UPI000757ABD4|nr:polysaccharide biosynthesis tyrosine autokinase [Burkholderia stagnalis]KVO52094.1 protein tyrosine kinase [Burkholderia stagnalis]KVP11079.1 protein tyrosine kinase [Burkholderia stagnalis]KVW98849.1 protein tyrosine kinase [Burkholderia stagnalis]KWH83129.1 protein tyrosine kinase [Burkholderia stagnalis]KWK21929.1 protein tyrosine kinase [Burkholderia stagnalis]
MNRITEAQYLDVDRNEDISLSEYLAILQDNRRLIAVIASVVTLLSTMYAFFSAPVYRANMVVQVQEQDMSSKALLGDLAPLLGAKSETTAEIEILQSRLVLGKTVSSLKLYIDARPRYFPLLGRWMAKRAEGRGLADADQHRFAAPFMGLTRFAWGGEKIEMNQFDIPKTYYEKKFMLVAGEAGRYELTDPDGDTVLKGRVGELARGHVDDGPVAILVGRLDARPGTRFRVIRYSELNRIESLQDKLKIAEQGKQSGILETTLEGSDPVETSATLNAIADEYVRQNVQLNSAEAEKTLVFLDQQLPLLKKALEASEERYNNFRNKRGTISLSEEAKLALQQSVDSTSTLLELQQKKLELQQRFGPEHPNIIAINRQISAAQQDVDQLSGHIAGLPDIEQSALRLMRDVTVNTDLYTGLLNSAQQLKILKAGKVGNVRIVDQAVVPEMPAKPKRPLVIALGLILGLGLGTTAAFVKRSIVRGVESADQIERATDLAIYAAVSHSENQKTLSHAMRRGETGAHLLAVSHPDDPTIESLRSLRTSLQFAMVGSANNVVMLTGPSPGIGKSFTTANLAAVLAASGKRVLLLDADMRRGHLHEFFGVSRDGGLSDVMVQAHTFDDVVRRNVIEHLDLMTTGQVPPNPAELLMTDRFSAFVAEASARYDIVLVDTPPVLAVTDATVIGKHAGTTLIALRYGQHPMQEIQETTRRLRNGGVQLKGIVFNGIPRRGHGYGRYYGGYYAYQYQKVKS